MSVAVLILGLVAAAVAWLFAVVVGHDAAKNDEHRKLPKDVRQKHDGAFALAFLFSIVAQVASGVIFWIGGGL